MRDRRQVGGRRQDLSNSPTPGILFFRLYVRWSYRWALQCLHPASYRILQGGTHLKDRILGVGELDDRFLVSSHKNVSNDVLSVIAPEAVKAQG